MLFNTIPSIEDEGDDDENKESSGDDEEEIGLSGFSSWVSQKRSINNRKRR